MGADKALLDFRGIPLASRIASCLAPVVDQVSLVGGDPGRYGALGYPFIPDERPGSGPVAGIVSALRSTASTWNIVSACDLPDVSPSLFAKILNAARNAGAQCLVPVTPDGSEQVLCAVYRRDALADLSNALDSGEVKLRTAVRRLEVAFWPVESENWPMNVNTPEDWARYARQEA